MNHRLKEKGTFFYFVFQASFWCLVSMFERPKYLSGYFNDSLGKWVPWKQHKKLLHIMFPQNTCSLYRIFLEWLNKLHLFNDKTLPVYKLLATVFRDWPFLERGVKIRSQPKGEKNSCSKKLLPSKITICPLLLLLLTLLLLLHLHHITARSLLHQLILCCNFVCRIQRHAAVFERLMRQRRTKLYKQLVKKITTFYPWQLSYIIYEQSRTGIIISV